MNSRPHPPSPFRRRVGTRGKLAAWHLTFQMKNKTE